MRKNYGTISSRLKCAINCELTILIALMRLIAIIYLIVWQHISWNSLFEWWVCFLNLSTCCFFSLCFLHIHHIYICNGMCSHSSAALIEESWLAYEVGEWGHIGRLQPPSLPLAPWRWAPPTSWLQLPLTHSGWSWPWLLSPLRYTTVTGGLSFHSI